MKKISAMYKTEKYHETKPGSIHDAVAQMQMNEQKFVPIKVNEFTKMIETYLAKGGVVNTTSVNEDFDLDEEINALPLNEVREFIETYNKWFLTNYRAEEFIISEKVDMGTDRVGGNPAIGATSGKFQVKKPGFIGQLFKKVKNAASKAKDAMQKKYPLYTTNPITTYKDIKKALEPKPEFNKLGNQITKVLKNRDNN